VTLLLNCEILRTLETRNPKSQKLNAPNMAITVKNALCFDWSTLPCSPGPGRVRAQRTEMLQNETTTREVTKTQTNRTRDKTALYSAAELNRKESSQTENIPMFLIMSPRLFRRPL